MDSAKSRFMIINMPGAKLKLKRYWKCLKIFYSCKRNKKLPLWILFSFLGLLLIFSALFTHTSSTSGLIVLVLLLAASISFIFWLLIFPAWLSIRFRYYAWRFSQIFGIIAKWFSSGWRPVFFLVSVVALGLFVQEAVILNSPGNITINSTARTMIIGNITYDMAKTLTPGFWMGSITVPLINVLSINFWISVFLISALLSIGLCVIRLRNKITMLQFSNQTGDDKLKSRVEAISPTLQNELARIAHLCYSVDDTNPFNPGTQAFQNTEEKKIDSTSNISVSIGESLKNIVSSDSKVKFGPLEIPIGATIGVFAKLIEGPQLTGSLLKEDGNLLLIANLSGGRYNNDWRISVNDIDEIKDSDSGIISQMVEQLTYCIFTDLTKEDLGSSSWKAVRHYIKGLRSYRETLRTNIDKNTRLRRAEKEFLLALGEDKRFLQCYYNLGIVFSALEQPESALSVLKKAIDSGQADENQSGIYYSLAINEYWVQDNRNIMGINADYQQSISLCKKAIELMPDDARNWDLLGRLMKYGRDNVWADSKYWRTEIAPIFEIATALAWRDMCCCACKHKKINSIKLVARDSTWDLALSHTYGKTSLITPYYEQAICLTPSDDRLYFDLGWALNGLQNWKEAAKYLEKAIRIKDYPAYWCELAISYSKLNNRKRALSACRHVMDHASSLVESLSILDQTEEAMISLMPDLLKQSSKADQKRLYEILSDWNWDFANVLLKLAGLPSQYVLISGNDDDRIKNFLIKRFRVDWVKDKSLDRIDDKIEIRDGKQNISLSFDPNTSVEKIKINDNEIHRFPAIMENDMVIIKEDPGDSARSKRLNDLIIMYKKDNYPKSNLFMYALSAYVKEQSSSENKDCSIKLANEIPILEWDLGREPELRLASNLLSNLIKIEAMTNKDEMRAGLEKLKERQLDGCWMWGYAKVLLSLSKIERDPEKKKWQLKEAFSILQRYCPPEIAIDKAQGQFALALAENGDISNALFQAQHSVALSPEESWDRSTLSYVYQHFNSFEESNSQLEICMNIDPEYDYSYESMAWAKLDAINQLCDQQKRELALKKYIEFMHNFAEIQQNETLLDLNSANDNIISRAKAYFWLGIAYHRLNDYDMAISSLEKSRNLLRLNKGSLSIAMLSLGIVYLDIKAYSKSESVFNELIKNINENGPGETLKTQSISQSNEQSSGQIDAESAKKSLKTSIDQIQYENELIGDDLIYDSVPVGYVLARACLVLSKSYIQRDANFPEANYLIDRASGAISNLNDNEPKNRERKIKLDAMYNDCSGLLIFRQLRLGYAKNRINECIKSMEEAINTDARPEYYLHLAQALEYSLEANDRPSERADSGVANSKIILKRALACCDHVIELDLQKKYTEETKGLQKRLEKLEKSIN